MNRAVRRAAGLLPLLLASCAVAVAQDFPASTPLNAPMPTVDYLLTLGPYGALVWGAWLLGKGVTVTVRVELSERDHAVLEKAVLTFEKATTVAWNALKLRDNR